MLNITYDELLSMRLIYDHNECVDQRFKTLHYFNS